jgi:hypothetical protein
MGGGFPESEQPEYTEDEALRMSPTLTEAVKEPLKRGLNPFWREQSFFSRGQHEQTSRLG